MVRSLLVAALAGGAAAQYYKIDPSFPAPGALPAGVEEVTAVAVVNATSGKGGVEVHVAQRNASHPFFMVLDPASGKLLRTWNGSLVSPHGMVADPSGESLWVADIAGDAVQQYAIGGKLLRAVGSKGNGINPPQFSAVADIAVTPDGAVMTSDGDGGSNNRVLVLNGSDLSDVLYGIGGAGTGPGQFSSPHSIAYEDAGTGSRMWVADRGNGRLQAFEPSSGLFQGQWALTADCGAPAGAAPWGVRHDHATGRLLVVDGALGNLYVLKGTGAEPSPGMLPGCGLLQTVAVGPAASKPHELAVDPQSGDLYVANVGTPTGIVRLLRTG